AVCAIAAGAAAMADSVNRQATIPDFNISLPKSLMLYARAVTPPAGTAILPRERHQRSTGREFMPPILRRFASPLSPDCRGIAKAAPYRRRLAERNGDE